MRAIPLMSQVHGGDEDMSHHPPPPPISYPLRVLVFHAERPSFSRTPVV